MSFFRGLFFDIADVQQKVDGVWLQTGGCRIPLKLSDRFKFQIYRTELMFFALSNLFVKKAGSAVKALVCRRWDQKGCTDTNLPWDLALPAWLLSPKP